MADIGIDPGGLITGYQYLTGNTPKQRREKFIENELPGLAEDFLNTHPDSPEEMALHGIRFWQKAKAAGFSDEGADNLLNRLLPVARAKTAAHVYQDIQNGRKQRADQISEQDITNEDPTQGLANASGQLDAYKRQGDYNQDDALKLGQLEATT